MAKRSITLAVFIFMFTYAAYSIFLILQLRSDYPTKPTYGTFAPYLADKPISEDGYYLLTVARNIGAGKGIVYNEGVKTTGIQPLASFIYGGFYAIGNLAGARDEVILKSILIFSTALLLLTGMLLYRYFQFDQGEREKGAVLFVSLLLTIMNFDLFIPFTNGLETGIYTFFVLLSILQSRKLLESRVGSIRKKNLLITGVVWGMTALTRIDFVLLSMVFLMITIAKKKIAVKEGISLAGTEAFFLLPWVLYISRVTGSIVQSSMTAQTGIISIMQAKERLLAMLYALMELSMPLIATTHHTDVLLILFIALIVSLFLLYKRKKDVIRAGEDGFIFLAYWEAAIGVFAAVYALYSSATYFYLRYMIPAGLVMLIFWGEVLLSMQNYLTKRVILTAVSAGAVVLFLTNAFLYFHSGRLGVEQNLRIAFINTHFSAETKVGAFQSGVTGYYCPHVYNLDGKIDQRVWKEGGEKSLEAFLDKQQITAVLEWKEVFTAPFWKEKWSLYSSDIGDHRTVCYIRKGSKGEELLNNMGELQEIH